MSVQLPQSRRHGDDDAIRNNPESRPQPVSATRKVRWLGSTGAARPAVPLETPRVRKKIRRLDPVPGLATASAAATSASPHQVAMDEIRGRGDVRDDPNPARNGSKHEQRVAYVVVGTMSITSPEWWFVCPRCRGTGKCDPPGTK
jgi:hypothetical protein